MLLVHETEFVFLNSRAKIQVENKKGQTALDIAKAYGDPRIIHLVQSKWDALPPLPGIGDKRKRGEFFLFRF